MNFAGLQNNTAFKATSKPDHPYYYISAHLDLTGLHTGQIIETDPYIFYFNKENNFNYLDSRIHPNIDEYGGFYPIDDDALISEVVVYANPSIIYEGNIVDLNFEVGGVYKPSIALREDLSPADLLLAHSMDVWGGPTGNIPGQISVAQLEDGQACYYGKEPQDPQPNPPNDANLVYGSRRYLALRFVPFIPVTSDNKEVEVKHSARPIPRNFRPKKPTEPKGIQKQKFAVQNRQIRVVIDPLIKTGTFHVVVKILPKAFNP